MRYLHKTLSLPHIQPEISSDYTAIITGNGNRTQISDLLIKIEKRLWNATSEAEINILIQLRENLAPKVTELLGSQDTVTLAKFETTLRKNSELLNSDQSSKAAQASPKATTSTKKAPRTTTKHTPSITHQSKPKATNTYTRKATVGPHKVTLTISPKAMDGNCGLNAIADATPHYTAASLRAEVADQLAQNQALYEDLVLSQLRDIASSKGYLDKGAHLLREIALLGLDNKGNFKPKDIDTLYQFYVSVVRENGNWTGPVEFTVATQILQRPILTWYYDKSGAITTNTTGNHTLIGTTETHLPTVLAQNPIQVLFTGNHYNAVRNATIAAPRKPFTPINMSTGLSADELGTFTQGFGHASSSLIY